MPSHTLYIDPISAPCRAAHLHLVLLNATPAGRLLDVEIQPISLFRGEHKTDAFLSINPRHTVPTLVTPFGTLLESRAIMKYLGELLTLIDPSAETYYPRYLYQRARVHELLDWDLGTFYKAVGAAVYPSFSGGEATSDQLAAVLDVVEHIENHLLAQQPFLCGDTPTIADISIAMGMSMLELPEIMPPDCPRVDAWMGRLRAAPGWDLVNAPFAEFVASRRAPAAAPVDDSATTAQSESAPSSVEDQHPEPTEAPAQPSAAPKPDAPANAKPDRKGKKARA